MNKSFRVQCTVDIEDEYSAATAVQNLTSLIKDDGDNWGIVNVQILNVYEITEKGYND